MHIFFFLNNADITPKNGTHQIYFLVLSVYGYANNLIKQSHECVVHYTGPPRNVTLTAPTSTTSLLRWKVPEEDSGDGTISQYNILCRFSDGDSLQPLEAFASIQSLQLTDLHPFTTYNCCVSAQRTNGNSPESCSSETTPQDGEIPEKLLSFQLCTLSLVH